MIMPKSAYTPICALHLCRLSLGNALLTSALSSTYAIHSLKYSVHGKPRTLTLLKTDPWLRGQKVCLGQKALRKEGDEEVNFHYP